MTILSGAEGQSFVFTAVSDFTCASVIVDLAAANPVPQQEANAFPFTVFLDGAQADSFSVSLADPHSLPRLIGGPVGVAAGEHVIRLSFTQPALTSAEMTLTISVLDDCSSFVPVVKPATCPGLPTPLPLDGTLVLQPGATVVHSVDAPGPGTYYTLSSPSSSATVTTCLGYEVCVNATCSGDSLWSGSVAVDTSGPAYISGPAVPGGLCYLSLTSAADTPGPVTVQVGVTDLAPVPQGQSPTPVPSPFIPDQCSDTLSPVLPVTGTALPKPLVLSDSDWFNLRFDAPTFPSGANTTLRGNITIYNAVPDIDNDPASPTQIKVFACITDGCPIRSAKCILNQDKALVLSGPGQSVDVDLSAFDGASVAPGSSRFLGLFVVGQLYSTYYAKVSMTAVEAPSSSPGKPSANPSPTGNPSGKPSHSPQASTSASGQPPAASASGSAEPAEPRKRKPKVAIITVAVIACVAILGAVILFVAKMTVRPQAGQQQSTDYSVLD
jgi:hypothetical protein